jgi:adenosylcobinamide-phosphate guanylyltransferase
MKALIMCGGRGERLSMGEKPMVVLGKRRLVEYVLDELWICDEVFAATTASTPKTEEFLKNRINVRVIRTSGLGYVEDMKEALQKLSIKEPILIVSGDLVIVRKNLIQEVIDYYLSKNARALQTAYPNGVAVGINIIDGMFLDEEQEEVIYTVSRDDVLNINTPDELKKAEIMKSNYGKS